MKHDIIYEVRLEIDADIEQEYDAWLADHVDQMLRIDGFLAAEILVPEPADPGSPLQKPSPRHAEQIPEQVPPPHRVIRQVQYHVATRQHLEDYFREHAARMREQGVQRFGDRFSASREIYEIGVRPARTCQNCNSVLRGQYCEECGQRDKHRIISLWELLRDLVGDVFEVDSRIWRSLRPLLFKPGRLTTEYLRGRRVHYTPPLRLYLISSLVFFLVVFFNTDTDITFGDSDITDIAEATIILKRAAGDSDPAKLVEAVATIENASGNSSASEIAQASQFLKSVSGDQDIGEIIRAVKILNEVAADSEQQRVDRPAESETSPAAGASTAAAVPAPAPPAEPATRSGSLADNCEKVNVQGTPWDAALEKRAKTVCRHLTAEGGATRFLRDLIDNAPGMMFFFLPFIALVMAFLYPFSGRYYVEHLLFFVHFHSFFFVILTLTVLFARLPEVLPGQGIASGLLTTVVTIYIPVYLFVAMRRVYGQSSALTAVKYAVLGVAYLVSLLFSFAAMAFFTALSV